MWQVDRVMKRLSVTGMNRNLEFQGIRKSKEGGVKRILAAIITILISFTACEAAEPKPPIELPFAVHKAGVAVTTELWIVKKGIHQYLFSLEFEYNREDKSEKIWNIVVCWEKNEETGKSLKPGIIITLKIKI